MSAAIRFEAAGEDGTTSESPPPPWAVSSLHARREYPGTPTLTAVVEGPLILANGEIVEAAGYHAPSGILLRPNCAYSPIGSTREDALAAVEALHAVVEDFPFTNAAHRSAWLAMLLGVVGRQAYEGPAPLGMFDGNVPGVGKSKLADVISAIVTGRDMSRRTPPKSDEEWRKMITTIAMAGNQMVLLDNVGQGVPLGNPALDSCLTSTHWEDRKLGGNENYDGPVNAVWFVTGNNLELGADTTRRALPCRLASPIANPENRTGFAHANLLKWVKAERGRLYPAAVTILRAFFLNGCPKPVQLRPWGSFEGWSDLVRGALSWLGQPDPCATREDLIRDDPIAGPLSALLSVLPIVAAKVGTPVPELPGEFGVSSRDLEPLLAGGGLGETAEGYAEAVETLREAIVALSNKPPHQIDSRVIGYALRKLRDRPDSSGRQLGTSYARGSGGYKWYVKRPG
jgi:hypothetical protein